MSKKANPTAIGLFVVLGLALAVIAIVTFGAGKWFTPTEQFILYFNGSVRGLNPGSAVMVHGVKVGTVKDVLIHYNQKDGDAFMPVIIEINEDMLDRKADKEFQLTDPEWLKAMVQKGLRAQLQAESLVTGLLYVDLSVMPNSGPPVYHQVKPLFPEIPTVPNNIEVLMDNLARLDIKGISERLDAVLVTLNNSLGELQMQQINSGLTNLLDSLNTIVAAPSFTNALASLNQTLEETRLLAENLHTNVNPLASSAERTLADARQTMADLRQAVEDLRELLAPDAPLKRDLNGALDQISQAARSVSELADYLSRNPNALLSGRKREETAP